MELRTKHCLLIPWWISNVQQPKGEKGHIYTGIGYQKARKKDKINIKVYVVFYEMGRALISKPNEAGQRADTRINQAHSS